MWTVGQATQLRLPCRRDSSPSVLCAVPTTSGGVALAVSSSPCCLHVLKRPDACGQLCCTAVVHFTEGQDPVAACWASSASARRCSNVRRANAASGVPHAAPHPAFLRLQEGGHHLLVGTHDGTVWSLRFSSSTGAPPIDIFDDDSLLEPKQQLKRACPAVYSLPSDSSSAAGLEASVLLVHPGLCAMCPTPRGGGQRRPAGVAVASLLWPLREVALDDSSAPAAPAAGCAAARITFLASLTTMARSGGGHGAARESASLRCGAALVGGAEGEALVVGDAGGVVTWRPRQAGPAAWLALARLSNEPILAVLCCRGAAVDGGGEAAEPGSSPGLLVVGSLGRVVLLEEPLAAGQPGGKGGGGRGAAEWRVPGPVACAEVLPPAPTLPGTAASRLLLHGTLVHCTREGVVFVTPLLSSPAAAGAGDGAGHRVAAVGGTGSVPLPLSGWTVRLSVKRAAAAGAAAVAGPHSLCLLDRDGTVRVLQLRREPGGQSAELAAATAQALPGGGGGGGAHRVREALARLSSASVLRGCTHPCARLSREFAQP